MGADDSPEVRAFLADQPEHLRPLLQALRKVVRATLPRARECVRWKSLSYEAPDAGGAVKAGLCQIGVRKGVVELAFVHGTFLPDPEELLQGKARYKRFVPISEVNLARSPALELLLTESLEVHRRMVDGAAPQEP